MLLLNGGRHAAVEVRGRFVFCQKVVHRSTTFRDRASPDSLRKRRARRGARQYFRRKPHDRIQLTRGSLPLRGSKDPKQEDHWPLIARRPWPTPLRWPGPRGRHLHPELTRRPARVAGAVGPIPAMHREMWRIDIAWRSVTLGMQD